MCTTPSSPKILFIDIDGVFNNDTSVSYYHNQNAECHPYKHLDPMCVENLRYIIKKVSNLYIVISSSWRHACQEENKKEILMAFQEHKLILPLHNDWHTIRHWTIDKNYIKGRKPSRYKIDWRGNEVAEWLYRHPEIGPNDFICLDDNSDYINTNNLVQTETSIGLTRVETDIIIGFFLRDTELLNLRKKTITKYYKNRARNNLNIINKVHKQSA